MKANDSNCLYEGSGDITHWFKANAPSDLTDVLKRCVIERVEVVSNGRGEPAMDRLLGAPPRKVGTYRIRFDSVEYTIGKHPMPRDVWFVLRGIWMAINAAK
jgi:hypothetical protein